MNISTKKSIAIIRALLSLPVCKFARIMDQTKRPLLIPPELATYAEEHDLFDTYRVSLVLNSSLVLAPHQQMFGCNLFIKYLAA